MNTSKEIIIKYKWDEKSFLSASKIAYDYELKHSLKRYLGWLFIILAQFGVVAALKKGAFGLLFISTILLIYWYLLRWPLRAFFIKRGFQKSNLANKEFEATISDKFIAINGIKIKWSDINEVISTQNGYLLKLDNQILFLPKSAFKDEAKSYFLELAQSKSKYTKES